MRLLKATYLPLLWLISGCGSNVIPLNESPNNDRDRLELAEKIHRC